MQLLLLNVLCTVNHNYLYRNLICCLWYKIANYFSCNNGIFITLECVGRNLYLVF